MSAGWTMLPAPDLQQLLHRFPQPLYDGDRAVLADGAKALADAKGSDVGAECFARELRAVVRHEVPRRPVALDRRVEEGHEVLGGGLLWVKARRERHAGANIEDPSEDAGQDPQETRDLGQISHPHLVRVTRHHRPPACSRRWQWSVPALAPAADRLGADLDGTAGEGLRDALAAAEIKRLHRGDEVADDVAVRPQWRHRLHQAADRLLRGLPGRLLEPAGNGSGRNEEALCGLLSREQPGLHEDQNLETLGRRVVAAPASFDPLKPASEAGVLLLEHDDTSQKLTDPRLEGAKRIASLPQPGNREADGEQ